MRWFIGFDAGAFDIRTGAQFAEADNYPPLANIFIMGGSFFPSALGPHEDLQLWEGCFMRVAALM